MDFIIDTVGSDTKLSTPSYNINSQENKSNSLVQKLLAEYNQSKSLEIPKACPTNKVKVNKFDLFQQQMGWIEESDVDDTKINARNPKIVETLKKSVITPDFEKLHTVPPYDIMEKKLKDQRRREREKSKGKKWFGLPATEVTDEIKKDLEVLQMRSVLDPKHFYKKNDLKVLPKYFQVGKVMDSPLDYYNSRLTKKERKKTLVDELMADAEFNKYNKKKYLEIIEEKQKTHYKAYRQARKLKRKNKK